MVILILLTRSPTLLISSFFDQVHPRSRVVTTTTAPATSTTSTITAPTTTTTTTTVFDQTATTATPPAATARNPTTLFANKRHALKINNDNHRQSWRSTQQVLYTMDQNFNKLIRQHHNQTRLQNPLSHSTTSHYKTHSNHSLFKRTITSYRSNYSRDVTEISNRNSINSTGPGYPKLLQLDVRHPKKEWWRTSRLQSQATEPVRGSSPLQNGNY